MLSTLLLPLWLFRPLAPALLSAGEEAWTQQGWGAVRGVTIGPIENQRHAGRGYGSPASGRMMLEVREMGGNWISLTPFGRVWDLEPAGIDPTFEMPFEENKEAVRVAIRQAHAAGLKVLIVPHLWVESGEWRALIDPGTDEGWQTWREAYGRFVLAWAEIAAEERVEMFSVGVELRSWVTTARAPLFEEVIDDVRAVYPGLITYSANWDDLEHTLILDRLDVIGVNAFYPLAHEEGASYLQLREQGEKVADDLERIAKDWNKPILLSEIGYTNRADPALRPWEWPESMSEVTLDQEAQANAYAAILAPMMDEPWCVGFFVWRMYADPEDVSQEPEYGFSPRGKLAELVLRDAFTAHWAADGDPFPGAFVGRHRATTIGSYGGTLFEPLRIGDRSY